MIQHLHSALATDPSITTAGQSTSATLNQSTIESFHGALSDAVTSDPGTLENKSKDANTSITREDTTSRQDSTPKPTSSASSGTSSTGRSAPPTPGTSTAASGSSSSGASSTSTSSTSSTSSSSGPPDDGYDPFLQASYSNPFASVTTQNDQSTSPASSSSSASTPLTAQQQFDQAYWAAQPPAVQALQDIQDPEQRETVAAQLANEGYSIDVPIMVWGWDPSVVTSMRQADGYTWVPSALQNPVEDAPGLPAQGSVAAYNSSNPPSGSIAV